jgi:colanic acid/amylovoran biosynthesis glycosyltransferase
MRIGYVLKRYPRYSETFIVNEILAHEQAGVEVVIFALRPPIDSHFQDTIAQVRAPVHYIKDQGIRIDDLWAALRETRMLGPGLWNALDNALEEDPRAVYQALVLALEANRQGISHLHAHFATLATAVARLAASFTGLPYSFTCHAKDIFHEEVQSTRLAQYLREAAAVITVSEFNRNYLQRHYGEAAARVTRIYNGLDLERFTYSSPKDRAPLIVAIGRLVEKKGFAILIEACAHLLRTHREVRCEIIGAGPLEETLRQAIVCLGLQQIVSLIGPLPQCQIIDKLKRACVCALPCVVGSDGNRDGLPTVLLEAMALGTPCVSTDVTGIPEALRDGETGLLVPQHASRELAAAIASLLTDPHERVRLAQKAREHIENEFKLTRNAASLRNLILSNSVTLPRRVEA